MNPRRQLLWHIPTIRTINGGEYICRTANREKYAICESISQRIGQLCAYLENAEPSNDAYKEQILRNIAGLVNSDDPTSLMEPLRDEIADWFLLDTKTIPQDAQLMFIVRSLINEALKNGGITPARVGSKLKSTLWAEDQFRNMYDSKTGKKVEGFR